MAAPTAPNYSIRAWLRRRSLASRVTWLTTVAVGLSVTIVSLASYLLVRSQSMHEIDVSLHNRASQAARTDTLENLSQQQFPPYLLGAADVSVIFLTVTPTGGRVRSANAAAAAQVGLTEMAVAQRSDTWSARTVKIDGDHYRMVAVTAGKNEALILAQSIEPTDKMLDRLGFVMLFFGLSGMFAAGASGWGVAQTACARCELSPTRSSGSPAPKTSPRSRLRAQTRSLDSPPPSTNCWPRSQPHESASVSWWQMQVTSCVRRSRHCAPTLTSSYRLKLVIRCLLMRGESSWQMCGARSKS